MSVDLSTQWLGLRLAHPLMPGASPLVDDMDTVKRLEDAGAPCIVMHSLFEEQIERDDIGTGYHLEAHDDSFAEALSYFPRPEEFSLGPDQYLDQIRRIRAAVAVPVIASLNGVTAARWLGYSRLIEKAGASALELNVYHVATDPQETGESVERRTLDIVERVKEAVSIPIAVKLSPFFSSLAHMASEIDRRRADGLILFNRFYQPDIDVDTLEITPRLRLSESSALMLRLRWLAVLSGRVSARLAVTGGVHTAEDAIKAVMAGAHAVQIVSALLRHGPERLHTLREEMAAWMEEHEYASVEQMRGCMSLERCPNPGAVERANYMRVLQSWSPPERRWR
jgi:dihydroorotate dehydrogenase (fumarate)